MIEISARQDEHAELFTIQAGTSSLLVLPLTAQGRIIGCLTSEAKESGAFNESNIRFASALAERLCVAISAVRFEAEAWSFSVTVSIGISECLGVEDSLENLLARSDQALYQAKNTGRNRVVIWSPT